MDRKKIYSIASLALFVLFMGAGTVVIWKFMKDFGGNPELFKQALEGFGEGRAAFVFLVLQVLQIVFPILPGELLELGAGYVFGPFIGLLLCEIGVLIASVPIFLLSKKFGAGLIENIFSPEKIRTLKFLDKEKNPVPIIFWLFFIPGTPKDLLTYFVGLTPIKARQFIPITLFARIPSILTSTLVGAGIGDGKIGLSIAIYAVTGLCSLFGIMFYSRYTKKRTVE